VGGPGLDFSHFLCDTRRTRTLTASWHKVDKSRCPYLAFVGFALHLPGSVVYSPEPCLKTQCRHLVYSMGTDTIAAKGRLPRGPHPAFEAACRLIKDDLNCICGVDCTSGSLCCSGLTAQRVGCGWANSTDELKVEPDPFATDIGVGLRETVPYSLKVQSPDLKPLH
jgi:hypothetical protein